MGSKGSGGFQQAVREHVRPVQYGGSVGSGSRRKRGDDDVDARVDEGSAFVMDCTRWGVRYKFDAKWEEG